MLSRWIAALVATGALCAAAGAAIGAKYAPRDRSSSSSSSGARETSTTDADAGDEQHTSPELRIAELQREVERQKQLRAQERSGRTNAEREAREAIQQQQLVHGYNFDGIAHVQSCFVERRGTPRQGVLVPGARARIKFRTSIPPASLECLDQFSHLWVIFVFHENTNVAKTSGSSATGKRASTFPAKIAPPRLGGQKVGLFSTRTPHRPNSIGLTVVKIDAVYGRYIEISGHDLVNGTPVLDVKPYTFADCVPSHVCPEWVSDSFDLERAVTFSSDASAALATLVREQKTRFYSTAADLEAAIAQMLVLDIRSVHQGRGHAARDQRFRCRFDNVEIAFTTLEDKIVVVECAYCPST